MADPIRLRIEKKLADRFREITPANGYQFDLSAPGQVVRGRIAIGDDDPVPLVSILEVPVPPDQHEPPFASDTFDGPWDLIIQGWCRDDPENPTDPGHYLMADVKRKLAEIMRTPETSPFANNSFLDEPKIRKMEITPGVVRPAESPSRMAFFWLSLRIHLVEKIGE